MKSRSEVIKLVQVKIRLRHFAYSTEQGLLSLDRSLLRLLPDPAIRLVARAQDRARCATIR